MKRLNDLGLATIGLLSLTLSASAAKWTIELEPSHPDGIYAKGELVSNGRSWDASEAELFLDGEQACPALKLKKYRHQKNGVRTVVVDGCPAGRHDLKIRPKAPWVWANLGIEEIAVSR